MDISALHTLIHAREDERLEFKEAKGGFHFEKLVKYCCALANEGGGKIVLGMTDKPPRRIVGSEAFDDLERTRAGLTDRLRIRIHTTVIAAPEGRVVVFEVPSRPLGVPLSYEGAYWMRSGDGLIGMTEDRLRAIFDEARPDFSALTCEDASLADLAPESIERFRQLWLRKSGRIDLREMPVLRLLEDAELIFDGKPSYAALILFGTTRALGRHLPQAEVIFEYREDESRIDYQQREEFRSGFLPVLDAVWSLLQRRNNLYHFQDGLFRQSIPTFNETVVREALLNAVSHRDYRHAGSVLVHQWPQKVTIVSPGGLPPGISPDNIFFRQLPRNRRIAEALARCGLVERSGQGADRMLSLSLGEGKAPPDFADTDEYQVSVTARHHPRPSPHPLLRVGRRRTKLLLSHRGFPGGRRDPRRSALAGCGASSSPPACRCRRPRAGRTGTHRPRQTFLSPRK